ETGCDLFGMIFPGTSRPQQAVDGTFPLEECGCTLGKSGQGLEQRRCLIVIGYCITDKSQFTRCISRFAQAAQSPVVHPTQSIGNAMIHRSHDDSIAGSHADNAGCAFSMGKRQHRCINNYLYGFLRAPHPKQPVTLAPYRRVDFFQPALVLSDAIMLDNRPDTLPRGIALGPEAAKEVVAHTVLGCSAGNIVETGQIKA